MPKTLKDDELIKATPTSPEPPPIDRIEHTAPSVLYRNSWRHGWAEGYRFALLQSSEGPEEHDPLCSEGEVRGDQVMDCDCSGRKPFPAEGRETPDLQEAKENLRLAIAAQVKAGATQNFWPSIRKAEAALITAALAHGRKDCKEIK
jgi:hypothetical protein